MGKKIYSVALGRMKEAWYQLSEEEQAEFMAEIRKLQEQDGAKPVIWCNSVWATHQWEAFGVMEFPDIEAVQRHAEHCAELNWLRYMDVITTLGTKVSEDDEP
jgi:hypothetical protein